MDARQNSAPRATALVAVPSRRRLPVRFVLIGIVFAVVLPGIILSGLLLLHFARSERSHYQQLVAATALRAAETIDRELARLKTSLQTLANSSSFDQPDLDFVGTRIANVARSIETHILYTDPAGQMRVSVPPDAAIRHDGPPPEVFAPEAFAHVARTRQTFITQLFVTQVGEPSVAILVPVLRQDRIIGTLAVRLTPIQVSAWLQRLSLDTGWIAALNDSQNRIIARTQEVAAYAGRLATPDFRAHATGESVVWTGKTIEDTPVLAAQQRLRLANWRVAIGVPLHIVEAPLHQTMTLLIAGGTFTLTVAFILAWRLAHLVSAPLRHLAAAADALARGDPVAPVSSPILEVESVSRALLQATADLRSRADALAAERARLDAIIEAAPIGLMIAEAPSGRVVASNRFLNRMLRRPPGDNGIADYRDWTAHCSANLPVTPDLFPLARVIRGEPRAEFECRFLRGDGTLFWMHVIAAPILAEDGTVTGGVAGILDIDDAVHARQDKARFAERLEHLVQERTADLEAANRRLRDAMQARETAEANLRQSQKMEAVGQLTGGIAHDFNNLLTIIIGSLDLLRRRTDDDRTRRLVDNALEGATRAATLTARLLAFSRRQPLSPRPIDVNHLVAGMSDLLHRTLGEGIHVATRLDPALLPALADPNQLESALLNLAVNARDAMRSAERVPGTLTIQTSNQTIDESFAARTPDVRPGHYVAIRIADTGIGMTEETLARVFEPFFTTKGPGHGTGLGLSQVHGFVKQSGGHVDIDTRPGEGTAVTLYLPCATTAPAALTPANPAPDAPDPARPTAEPAHGPEHHPTDRDHPSDKEARTDKKLDRRSLTVLLVEDQDSVRGVSVAALQELGHTVIAAETPSEALRQLRTAPAIDLLLTDVILPEMNGARLAALVTQQRPDLPVLFTSGFVGGSPDRGDPLPPGAVLLPKPFSVQDLAERLCEAIQAATSPRTSPTPIADGAQ